MTRGVRFFVLALAAWFASLGAAQAQQMSLTILHTNDTHGHLIPFSYPALVEAGSPLEGLRERREIGGIARRATLAARIRAEVQARGGAAWLIDAGDFSDGTPFSTEYRGEADVEAMNAAGYTHATIGNHEFNYPLSQTRKLISMAKHPIFCANVVDAEGKLLAERYRIEKVGEVTVGVFGLVTKEAGTYPAANEGLRVEDEIQAARQVVQELKPKVDVIVLISHAGEDKDEVIAEQVPDIDVIVGGHSHSRLPLGQFIWHGDDLQVGNVNGTVIVQAHQWGGELGRLDLLFQRDAAGRWNVERYRARLIPVNGAVPPDAAVAQVVDRFWAPIAPRFGEVVGRAGGDFSTRGDDEAEYHLVADAVRETFGTDIGMENLGGVRAPLVEGPITKGDLVAMDPFDNTVMRFSISGRDLKRVLLQHAPAVSGIRYRIVNGELLDVEVGGQKVEDDRTYTGVTNSYFAGRALKGIEVSNTGKARLDVLTEYVRQKKTVEPRYDGRRVILGRRATGSEQ